MHDVLRVGIIYIFLHMILLNMKLSLVCFNMKEGVYIIEDHFLVINHVEIINHCLNKPPCKSLENKYVKHQPPSHDLNVKRREQGKLYR